MRKTLLTLALAITTILAASAQFYETGVESGKTKWNQIDTERYKLIFPQDFAEGSLRFSAILDTIYPWVNYNFKEPMRKIPIILRTKNQLSNGYVVWSPKRSEMVTTATMDDTYALSWAKQLTIHESRHIAQMSLMKTGLTKLSMWVLGEAGISVGLSSIAKWQLEGDATLAETQFAEYGRGIQPEFTLVYRGIAADGKLDLSKMDPWKSGSYLNYTPGIYEFGYQLISAAETYLSPTVNYEVFRYSAKYPILIVPEYFYLKKRYKTTYKQIAQRAFAEMDSIWKPTYTIPNSFETLTPPARYHTDYTNPLAWDDKIIATKWDMTRPTRFVVIDTATMKESLLHSAGSLTSRPVIHNNTIYWTEYKPHPLYAQQNFSAIRSIDLLTGERRVYDRWGFNYYVTPMSKGRFAIVTNDTQSNSYIRIMDSTLTTKISSIRFATPTTLHSLAWDSTTERLYFIALDDRGMWIGASHRMSGSKLKLKASHSELRFGASRSEWEVEEITAPSVVTIRDLTARNGKLYFSSIQSGKNEIHSIDLSTGEQHRQTTSRLASQNPSTMGDSALLFSTYTPGGWAVAKSNLKNIEKVEWSRLPKNTLNPKRYKWNVPVIDSIQITTQTTTASDLRDTITFIDSIQITPQTTTAPTPKRYHRLPHSFNLHSWAPLPFKGNDMSLSENPIHLAFGASAFFQSILGEMTGYAAYGWVDNMNWLKGNATYLGLPIKIEVDAEYGGGYQEAYFPSAMTVNTVPSTTLAPYLNISATLSLPLNLTRGANLRLLQPSLTIEHNNSLKYDEPTSTYGSGVQLYNASLYWSDTRVKGYRSILPRLGYALRLTTVGAINSDFSTIYAATGRAYLPGFTPTHTLTIAATTQYQPADQPYKLSSKSLIPRGVKNPYRPKNYTAIQTSYVMPLFYPDWGIDGLLYIRRVSTEMFFDYSTGGYYSHTTKDILQRDQSSYGAVVSIENTALGSFSNTFAMTFAQTYDMTRDPQRKVWIGVSMAFDF